MTFMPDTRNMPMPPGFPRNPVIPPWAMSMAGGVPDTATLIRKILEQRQTPTVQPPNLPSLNPQLPQPKVYDVRPTAQGQRQSFMDKLGGRGNVGSFLQNTGMALMAQSDTPGSSFLGNLGRALPYGLEAVDARKQDAAVNEALEGMDLPPQMKALLGALPAAQRVGVLIDMMQGTDPDREYIDLANGQIGIFENGRLVTQVGPEDVPEDKRPSSIREAQDYLELDEDARAVFDRFNQPQPGATVNINTAEVPGSLQEGVAQTLAQRGAMREKVASIANLDEALEITTDEEFKKVTGLVGGTLGDVMAKAGFNPEAAELAQRFDLLQSGMALDILRNFTGPKSDYEFQMASRMASGDRTLTAGQLQAGIRFLKREARRQAVDWADDVLWYAQNPDLYGIEDPRLLRREIEQAREIMDKYGSGQPTAGPPPPPGNRPIPNRFR